VVVVSRSSACQIVPASIEHWRGWNRLFRAYASFCHVDQAERTLEIVWQWLLGSEHPLSGLIALDEVGEPAGIAHYRTIPQSLTGNHSGFSDDLFVDSERRRQGVARALFTALAHIGRSRGWCSLSWMTAEDNARTRTLYDQVATKTVYLTYRMALCTQHGR